MLKKQNRITSRFEFGITRKHGDYYRNPFFHMYILKPRNYEGTTRFGIVVSKKVTKIAVTRNRMRRVFREVIQHNLDKFPENLWVVIHPTGKALDSKYEEINTQFNKTLSKVSFPN